VEELNADLPSSSSSAEGVTDSKATAGKARREGHTKHGGKEHLEISTKAKKAKKEAKKAKKAKPPRPPRIDHPQEWFGGTTLYQRPRPCLADFGRNNTVVQDEGTTLYPQIGQLFGQHLFGNTEGDITEPIPPPAATPTITPPNTITPSPAQLPITPIIHQTHHHYLPRPYGMINEADGYWRWCETERGATVYCWIPIGRVQGGHLGKALIYYKNKGLGRYKSCNGNFRVGETSDCQ
jgi:hypothetical protein